MNDKMRKLNIAELIDAFEMGSANHPHYLDLETGAILFRISDDVEYELNVIEREFGSEESTYERLVEYINQREMPEWLKAEVLQAIEIEHGFGTHYIAIPWVESRDGYREMELFIDTVEDDHVQQLLSVAIDERGAFRRFKDVLYDYPKERERWFSFKKGRMRQRVLAWLDDEGIEVIE